jgi:transposase InsO family protein
MCTIFNISRQAYYQSANEATAQAMHQEMVEQLVHDVRRQLPRLGGKKLYHMLGDDLKGIRIGRDKFFDILRCANLLVERKRSYVITTQSHHRFRVYTNLIKNKKITRSDQVYVCDITYLRLHKGFVYLFLITDAYSRKIVGWYVSNHLGIEGAIRALKMALKESKGTHGRIHHSDRGIQYCSYKYTTLLKQNNIAISMAATGDVYENAMAERVNGILKDEFMLDATFTDLPHATRAVKQAIKAYNNLRPHMSLKMKTPAQVYAA